MVTLCPRDEKDLTEIVVAAIANGTPLGVIGGGSRSGLGRPSAETARISTSKMSGVTMYEPSELVLTAQAGTPLSTILDLIDQQAQELAFEPMDHGPLYGHSAGGGTIGGLVAVNASGPRRFKAGAARDHVLGFRAVSGRGEVFQSGGRVMKNVTGYDMSKLMTGSYGTLGVMSEVIVKVLPKAETQNSLAIAGLEDAAAIAVMTFASGLPQEVSGLAHIPDAGEVGAGLPVGSGKAVTVMRVEGPEASVTQRMADIRDALTQRFGDAGCRPGAYEVMDAGASKTFWRAVRDATSFAVGDDQIWRISTAPTEGAEVVAGILAAKVPLIRHIYDWAGGLIWLGVSATETAHAKAVRDVVERHGGHATLIRASDSVRSMVPVFHPQAPALAALSERVKRGFDPELILNRGRMRSDI
jgi:glycolate oxidase FAD binding subunit